jgi:hypothetical protein
MTFLYRATVNVMRRSYVRRGSQTLPSERSLRRQPQYTWLAVPSTFNFSTYCFAYWTLLAHVLIVEINAIYHGWIFFPFRERLLPALSCGQLATVYNSSCGQLATVYNSSCGQLATVYNFSDIESFDCLADIKKSHPRLSDCWSKISKDGRSVYKIWKLFYLKLNVHLQSAVFASEMKIRHS